MKKRIKRCNYQFTDGHHCYRPQENNSFIEWCSKGHIYNLDESDPRHYINQPGVRAALKAVAVALKGKP